MGNVLSDLAGGAVSGLLDSVGNVAVKIREAIKGKEIDPAVAAQIESHIVDLESALQQGQMAINLEDAKSGSFWQAGWRPYIGWVCGTGLTIQYIILPILACFNIAPKTPLDFGALITLLLALLGMTTYRTVERIRGVGK